MVDGRKVYKRNKRKGNPRMNYTHAEVASLDPQTMRTLCEEYLANNYIDPESSAACATRMAPVCWQA